MTQQERATEASLRVAWVLGKNQNPFSDAEVVKECLDGIVEAMFEGKEKQEMSEKCKQIPLSNCTSTRRTEVLADDVVKQLTDDIKNAQCISLAVDESTDSTGKAQLCVFVRYFSKVKGKFCEDLLGLTTLNAHTRGEDIYAAIMQMLNERGIDIKTVVSIATDGAPAMIGKEKGAVQRLKEHHPDLLSYHCIIHQSVLCASLGKEYSDVMENIMKLVNYLRASSALQHSLLRAFLTEVNAAYDDLLLHSNVRWLSRRRVLERFWAVRKDLEMFLSEQKNAKARKHLDFLQDDNNMELVAFLVDITSHLNELNLKLQGQGNTVCDLMAAVRSFERRLENFKSDITEAHLHFPTLLQQTNGNHHHHHVSFLGRLAENFSSRFDSFNVGRQLLLCIGSPFLVKNVEEFSREAKSIFPWASAASLQTELIDLQEHVVLSEVNCDPVAFWTKMVTAANSPNLQKVAIFVLTMFGSTYHRKDDAEFADLPVAVDQIEEVILVSQGLPEVSRALKDLVNYVQANPRTTVCLSVAEAEAVKAAFACLICGDAMRAPTFASCCKSLAGCRTCVERWQANHHYCPKCRAVDSQTESVVALDEALAALHNIVSSSSS
ncbi:protein FAM200A-like [Diretmus argenteus]